MNCQKILISSYSIRVDKQLLPCRARCKFTRHMANKLEKFGLKLWLAVHLENKYLFYGFPYRGKNETRNQCEGLSIEMVMKLLASNYRQDCNVTFEGKKWSLVEQSDKTEGKY